jgi:hypothetical protein
MTLRALSSAVLVALVLAAAPARADMQTAINLIKHSPGVLDVVPDNAGNLWVTVLPNGNVNWSAYAAQMCRIVVPQKARIFLIKVVDATTVAKSKSKTSRDWRLLGGANCAAQ